jgi:hypothetical protein
VQSEPPNVQITAVANESGNVVHPRHGSEALSTDAALA